MNITAYLRLRKPSTKYGRTPQPVLTSKPNPTLKAEVKVPKPDFGKPAINQIIVDEISKRFTDEVGMKLTISTEE